MSAILFGSISTVADTSELQRQAFNMAFEVHGLDWRWEQEDYRSMLAGNGGRQRIADYAESRGEQVDADAVHATKSSLFAENLGDSQLSPRAGVAETIGAAKEKGWKVGLVTTTARENISALLSALGDEVGSDDFDVIVDVTNVDAGKPDKAAYVFAMDSLGESPTSCVAVEDNVGGVESAKAAGIACVAFPNENTAGHDFSGADRQVDTIDADELGTLASSH